MQDVRPKGTLDRTAMSDLWRRTLAQIPSVFGRLVYLSSLRNTNTGAYEHQGLALAFGAEEADRALKESHRQNFGEWLNFTLPQQKADLELYLAGLTVDRRAVVETWLKVAPYGNLPPEASRSSENELFRRDFKDLLENLRRDYSVTTEPPDE